MPTSTPTVAVCHAELVRVTNLLRRAVTPSDVEELWQQIDEWLDRQLKAMQCA